LGPRPDLTQRIILTMRELLLLCLLAGPTCAQTARLGAFTNSGDVGGPVRKGSTVFDASQRQYRITGAGANIWAKEDQFQYVWRQMSGDLAVTATVQFLGEGAGHRKAGIMLRQTLDTDSPYIDLVIHGTGMPGIQWRNNKGEVTNAFDFPFDGPAKFKLKLIRQGNTITVSVAKDRAELRELGHTQIQLANPVLVGLAVCSHNADASETVVFSDVSVEPMAPAGKKQ
jgi:TolB protein